MELSNKNKKKMHWHQSWVLLIMKNHVLPNSFMQVTHNYKFVAWGKEIGYFEDQTRSHQSELQTLPKGYINLLLLFLLLLPHKI